MAKKSSGLLDIVIRYLILVLVALPNLFLFYFVFKPLTAYPVFWLLSLFHNAIFLNGDIIVLNLEISIELIRACIAGSAYYLLLILNLSTPKIKLKQRINLILTAFGAFLVLNILRIFFLSLMAVSGSSYFNATHQLFWYLFSTVFVIGIWFVQVKKFKIKEIPFYSDLKFLLKKARLGK
ncbi:MAG TPA: pacearchaeosortase [Candidatus Pacearchaeota archaeon]|nr:pacearchaeosortase [Candidatus Pacearchaeota archaeon]